MKGVVVIEESLFASFLTLMFSDWSGVGLEDLSSVSSILSCLTGIDNSEKNHEITH